MDQACESLVTSAGGAKNFLILVIVAGVALYYFAPGVLKRLYSAVASKGQDLREQFTGEPAGLSRQERVRQARATIERALAECNAECERLEKERAELDQIAKETA